MHSSASAVAERLAASLVHGRNQNLLTHLIICRVHIQGFIALPDIRTMSYVEKHDFRGKLLYYIFIAKAFATPFFGQHHQNSPSMTKYDCPRRLDSNIEQSVSSIYCQTLL